MFRLVAPVLALAASLLFASSALADTIAISVTPTTVAAGGDVVVAVTPLDPGDGFNFHEGVIFVMKPGLACPTGDSYPESGATVGSNSAGPFRPDDPAEDVTVSISPDAPAGTAAVCSQTWQNAGPLAGDAQPGPSATIHITAPAGSGSGASGGDGTSDPAGPPTGGLVASCSLTPHRLRHGTAQLRLRCPKLPRAHLRLHLRCVPRRGAVAVSDRTLSLSAGHHTVRLANLRAGRCTATLRHGTTKVGQATLVVA